MSKANKMRWQAQLLSDNARMLEAAGGERNLRRAEKMRADAQRLRDQAAELEKKEKA